VVPIDQPTQISPTFQYQLIPSTNADMKVSAINGQPNTGSPDQVFIGVNDCITLQMNVKFRTGAFLDVTNDADTQFYLDPPRGHFNGKNVWCPNPTDADKVFPIYGTNSRPSAGQTIKDTVIVHVHR